jgi:membrane associated rhomboid family serine protease
MVGPSAEKEFGSLYTFYIIMFVAVASAVAHMLLGPKDGYQLGASGVVFAMIILNSLISATNGTIPMSFIITTALWVSGEISGFFFPTDNVSHIAHLSGAAAGAAAGYYVYHIKEIKKREANKKNKFSFFKFTFFDFKSKKA